MQVYQIYDNETDAYTAWAAENAKEAVKAYLLTEKVTNLDVSVVWPNPHPVEGDDALRFPIEDWREAVARRDTDWGYAEWLAEKLTEDLRGI